MNLARKKRTAEEFSQVEGENENAVKWQIWAALLTHLLLRFLKFKAKANCSDTRFVGFVRAVVWLKEVKRLLRSTRDPIDAIAAQCGYTNPTYLKSLFRKRFAMSMRDFRNQARK